MPQNAGKHVSESFKFQIFPGEHAPGPPRGACSSATRRACYASTIHFSRLLSSDQTPITFSNDNPEEYSPGPNLPVGSWAVNQQSTLAKTLSRLEAYCVSWVWNRTEDYLRNALFGIMQGVRRKNMPGVLNAVDVKREIRTINNTHAKTW